MRAVAALLVLLFHVTEQAKLRLDYQFLGGAFHFGAVGLDLFFVVSGFIIFHIHAKDWGRPERFASYIKKRLIRIYPFYWVILSGIIAAAFIVPRFASDRERSLECIVKSVFLIPQEELPILGVAWTLSHEMFFYLVFGALILVRKPAIRWAAAAWLIGSFFVAYYAPRLPPTQQTWPLAVTFGFSHFNLEFAAGVLVAFLAKREIRVPAFLVFGVGTALFVASIFVPPEIGGLLPEPLTRVITFGPSCALIVLSVVLWDLAGRSSWINRLLAVPGDASYSIYLIHYPVLVLLFATLGKRLATSPWLAFVTCVTAMAIALAVGIAIHFYVEKPLLRVVRSPSVLVPKNAIADKIESIGT